jgi:hypothetical protein
LKGIISRKSIGDYLLPTYKNQELSEAQKIRAKKRQDSTPAYELILNSFGRDIEASFGPGIFGRLEREMFTKAKHARVEGEPKRRPSRERQRLEEGFRST